MSRLQDNLIELYPGDVFCSRLMPDHNDGIIKRTGTRILNSSILLFQKIWSTDGEARYCHAGIILNKDGDTLEALGTVRRQNIFQDYDNAALLIGRHIKMNRYAFIRGYKAIAPHEGEIYPAWRLLLHMVPPLARFIHPLGKPVCSEYQGKFLNGCGFPGFEHYMGLTPDTTADRIIKWREFLVVYEA